MRCFDTIRPMRAGALRGPASIPRSSLKREPRLLLCSGDETGRARYLRDAHRLFTEMGATGHADRIAKELS